MIPPTRKAVLKGALATLGIALGIHQGAYFWEAHQQNKAVSSFTGSLVHDLKDGTLDDMIAGPSCAGSFFVEAQTTSLLDLHVIARADAEKWQRELQTSYEQTLDAIAYELDTRADFPQLSNLQKWETVFQIIQRDTLLEYDEACFDIGTTLETGCYNCNSSTQLFAATVLDLDTLGYLDAKPLRFIYFGDKEDGHVIVGYANTKGQIIHYFENTNPENYQDPRYKLGRVLTKELFVGGYLYGMGIDASQTAELLTPAIMENLTARYHRKPTEQQVSDEMTRSLVAIVTQREEIRKSNERNKSNEDTQVFDQFLFPSMGYDLEIVDSDEINYLERAEVWLALTDFSRAQFLVDIAYNRRQISYKQYEQFQDIMEQVASNPSYFKEGELCVDPSHKEYNPLLNHNTALQGILEYRTTKTPEGGLFLGNLSAWLFSYKDIELTFLTELTQDKSAVATDIRGAYRSIADIMEEDGFYEEALSSAFAAKELTEQGILLPHERQEESVAESLYHIGRIYRKARDTGHARQYFLDAKQQAEKCPDINSYFFISLAKELLIIKDYTHAEKVMREEALVRNPNSGFAYLGLGHILVEKNGYPQWTFIDLTSARDAYETALHIGEEQKDRSLQRDAHYALYVVYTNNQVLQNSEKAKHHFERYKQLQDGGNSVIPFK